MAVIGKILFVAVCLACSQVGMAAQALAQPLTSETRERAWFKPHLVDANDEACNRVLDQARAFFWTNVSVEQALFGTWNENTGERAGMIPVQLGKPNHGIEVENVSRHGSSGTVYKVPVSFVRLNGEKWYLLEISRSRCGGGCLLSQLVASREADVQPEFPSSEAPPPSPHYRLYKDAEGALWLYLLDEVSNDLLTYKLEKAGAWRKTCHVALRPTGLAESDDPDVRKAHEVLKGLEARVRGVTRGAGNCGSMKTHWRWLQRFRATLPSVLYRPWALEEASGWRARDAYGSYEKDLVGLSDWSLMGLSEHGSFEDYLSEMEDAVAAIATFYESKFGWDRAVSRELAAKALTTAVSTTIRFYHYRPIAGDAERAFRRAVLDYRPRGELEQIATPEQLRNLERDENLLSLSVRHPAALQYLLEAGLNPNLANAFGKTPLMYAVQYNQYTSAKILLDHGADPNARTTRPVDTCNYTIRTFDMTPLHYAVRYASPAVIKLLLDNGAAPFVEADNRRTRKKESPLLWLRRYTREGALEVNGNIGREDVGKVEAWLTTGADYPREDFAKKLVLKGERLYGEGRTTDAFQAIRLALWMAPDDARALSDMSLIGVRNGQPGAALEAAEKLITRDDVPDKLKANAWFNNGLACESLAKQGKRGALAYNGRYYCRYGFMYSFYKAFAIYPTEARKRKLRALFHEPHLKACTFTEIDLKLHLQLGSHPEPGSRGPLQSFFVLHRPERKIQGEDLAFGARFVGKGDVRIEPERVGSLGLGEYTLSLFSTGKTYARFPYEAFGYRCEEPGGTARKVTDSD